VYIKLSYRSLYRKWRPQTFGEVAGQEVASHLLTSALKNGQVNHAYLFCGPRGVGKTTTARILARSVNCVRGITPEPCGKCPSCIRIREGNSLDCVEIDAASHRGIDEIRELREKVKYSPLESRFKVYIIDEVHMLTTEAFNALLKTLEEPPNHAIFILATTEPQRLPDTILSRCLRINFNAIDSQIIVQRLRKIVTQEGYQADEEALYLVARKAGGSLRDAESFLEQLMSWGDTTISYQAATQILREIDETDLDAFLALLTEGQAGEALLTINQWITQGLDPEDIARALSHYFRTLLILALTQTNTLDGVSPQRVDALRQLLDPLSVSALRKALQRLQGLEAEMRRSFLPQILLELCILDIIDFLVIHPRGIVVPAASPQASSPMETPMPVEPETPTPTEPNAVGDDWQTVLQRLKKKKISLYALLQEAEFRESDNSKLILAFGPSHRFHKESVERTENFQILIDVIKEVRGKNCQLECIIDEDKKPETVEKPRPDTSIPDRTKAESEPQEKNTQPDQKNLLTVVVNLFSGLVVEYSAKEDHLKGGWEETEFEKSDEGSPENAG